jgi:hypothetical protein
MHRKHRLYIPALSSIPQHPSTESGSESDSEREAEREKEKNVSRPTGLCIKWPQEMDAKGCRAGVILKSAVRQLDAKLPVAVTSRTVRSNNNMQ